MANFRRIIAAPFSILGGSVLALGVLIRWGWQDGGNLFAELSNTVRTWRETNGK